MKMQLIVALASALSLGACQTTTDTKPATVVDPLVGKRLVSDTGTVFLMNADGTVGGEFRGEEVVGVYTANAREICSTYSAPERLTGQEYCSVPVINGDTVVFHRRDGSKSAAYKIGG